MALTDSESPLNAPRPDPVPRQDVRPAAPQDYLARLPLLHAEAARNARLGGFVAHSIQAAGLLMLGGAGVLLAGGGTLQSNFVWSVLVLAGIVAIALNHIRGQAQSQRRIKLESSAADLRAMLLYTGSAWGAGAFLALPADPGLLLAPGFALAPALLLLALLKDEAGIAAFTAPAVTLTVAAALVRHWTGASVIAPTLLAAGVAIVIVSYLQGRPRLDLGRPAA